MCRLYGMHADRLHRVECELIESQNALIRQSRVDSRGIVSADGWGIGAYANGEPWVVRQVAPAFESRDFREAAAKARAHTVIAQVRKAEVGGQRIENTQPFDYGRWLGAHNGVIEAFEAIRPRLVAAMHPDHGRAVRGDTDSEHLFHLMLSIRRARADLRLDEVVAEAVRVVRRLVDEEAPGTQCSVNLLITDGRKLAGCRAGRTLFAARRADRGVCAICGEVHADAGGDGQLHRAVAIASEPTTDEAWDELPEDSVFLVTPGIELEVASM
ncbi:MAG: class II glutamine amidotransferase [Planctomycetota bacterium]|nr:class II glutamine amidotransferase [Planctomycetota bacterium]